MPKHEAAPHSSNGATASRPPDGAFRNFASPARAAEVVSSNIVGYEKITLAPGFNMIGNQFLGVGKNAFQNINQMFAKNSELVAGGGDDEADTILVWDGSSYSNVYYYDSWDNSWYNTDDLEESTTDTIGAGMGIWFRHFGTETEDVTFAGEVPTNTTYSVQINTGFNMVANPYPVAICPNDEFFEVENAVAGGGDDEADSILVWDGSSYSKVYYYDSWDNSWYDTDNLEDPVSTGILKPAMGFWYRHKGEGGTLTFKRPFTVTQ